MNHRGGSKRLEAQRRDETHSIVGTPQSRDRASVAITAGLTIHTGNAEHPMSGATDKLVSTRRQAVSNRGHISECFVNPPDA